MRAYWTRIGLGALAIFVLGMVLIAGIRRTKDKAVEAIAELKTELGADASRAMLAGIKDSLAFNLDGMRLGTLRRLQIDKPEANTLPAVSAVVALSDLGDLTKVKGCDIVPMNSEKMDAFRCADSAESGLEKVGTVVFEGTSVERPFLVQQELAAKLTKGDAFHMNADLTGPVDAVVRKGDRDIVRIKADSNGARIRVTGKDGREIVNLKADSTGFSLHVDSAAKHQ